MNSDYTFSYYVIATPYTLAGFDLTTHSSNLRGGRRRRYPRPRPQANSDYTLYLNEANHFFKPELGAVQGDPIGRIFAHWVIVYFWQLSSITEVAHIFGLLFSTVMVVL
jgi:hypothetical protein